MDTTILPGFVSFMSKSSFLFSQLFSNDKFHIMLGLHWWEATNGYYFGKSLGCGFEQISLSYHLLCSYNEMNAVLMSWISSVCVWDETYRGAYPDTNEYWVCRII